MIGAVPALGNWVFEALIASSVLLGVVLLIREPVARHFGPRIAYSLWLLPALRMILPPVPESWSAPKVEAVETIAFILTGVAKAPIAQTGMNWTLLLSGVWAIGAFAFFGWHFLSYLRFSRHVRMSATPLFFRNKISVESSSHVASPMAFGLFGKTIVVPDDFNERYDPTEQRFAIDHELTHHRRGDLTVNLLAMGLLSLHWFNPLAHIAWRAFRLDQEAACDAIVLDGASADERHAYGNALFKSAAGNVPLAACTISAPATLKKRLRIILDANGIPTRAKSGAIVAGTVVLAGLALTASGGIAAKATMKAEQSSPFLALNGVIIETIAPVSPVAATRRATVQKQSIPITRALDISDAPTPPAPPVTSVSPAWVDSTVQPSPMIPPVEPVAPAPPEPETKITSLHRMILRSHAQPRVMTCDKGAAPHIIKSVRTEDGRVHSNVTMVVCKNDGQTSAAELRKALETARANLSTDKMATLAGRDRLLASLDREISRLIGAGTSLQ